MMIIYIYTLKIDNAQSEIIKVSLLNGESKSIYKFSMGSSVWGFAKVDVTPDGKTIVAAIQENISDVWMIENFDPDVE